MLNNPPITVLQILEINLGIILSNLLLLLTASQSTNTPPNKSISFGTQAPTMSRPNRLRTSLATNEKLQNLIYLVHFGRKRPIERRLENERSASRFEDIDGSKSDLESLDFEMTIIKTTEVIVCREG